MLAPIRAIAALLLALAGASALPTQAQQHHPTPQPVVAETVPAQLRPALWKVADEDTTIYLFGTIHILPAGVDWLDGTLATALDGSDELVTELPDFTPEQMQAAVLAHAVLPSGKTLRERLSDTDRARLEATLRQFQLPPETFDRFKLWYAAISTATIPVLREGYSPENGVEATLDARIHALGRPHSGLETIDEQLGAFDQLSEDAQRRYLIQVIESLPEIKQQLSLLVGEWGQGHAEKLAELLNADEGEPALAEALLYRRNRNWAGWIKSRLDKPGTVFIAVGAGHLAGKGSVQDQLAALGVATTRVQ